MTTENVTCEKKAVTVIMPSTSTDLMEAIAVNAKYVNTCPLGLGLPEDPDFWGQTAI